MPQLTACQLLDCQADWLLGVLCHGRTPSLLSCSLVQACAAFLAQHAGGSSGSLGPQQGTSSACQQNVMARYQSMLLKRDQEPQDAECMLMTRLAATAKLQAVLVPEALLSDS